MTGPELVAFMDAEGWSGRGLAIALDVSGATIWRWRSGKTAMVPAWERRIRKLRVPRERRRVAYSRTR